MLFRNPRVLPALLLCIGLGLGGIRAWELHDMPDWTPQDIETSVELNYMLDLARSRASASDPIPVLPPEEADRRKQAIRQDVLHETRGQRQKLESEMRQGILLVVVGALLYLGVLVMQKRGILPKA